MKKRVIAGGIAGSVLSSIGGGVALLGATATAPVIWPLIGGFAIGAGVTYVGTKLVEACRLAQAMEMLNSVSTTGEPAIQEGAKNEADHTEE